MLWDEAIAHLTRASGAAAIIAATFWKGDNLISKEGRKRLSAALQAKLDTPAAGNAAESLDLMRLYFSGEIPAWRFALNLLIFSSASLAILLIIYVSVVPGLFTQLLDDSEARFRFFKQFFTNGLGSVLIVNYFAFSLYVFRSRDLKRYTPIRTLAVDIILKITIFILCTAFTYFVFTYYFNSFSGNIKLALGAVGSTIWDAIFFRNLTSVYLYSVAVSSFPLFLSAAMAAQAGNPRFAALIQSAFFWLPFEEKPIRAFSVIVGIFVALFAFATALFANLTHQLLK